MTNSEQPGSHESRSPLEAGDERQANLSGHFGEIEDAADIIERAPREAAEFINTYIEEIKKDSVLSREQKIALAGILCSPTMMVRAERHATEVLLLLTNESLKDSARELFQQAMKERITQELLALGHLPEGLIQTELSSSKEGQPKQIEP